MLDNVIPKMIEGEKDGIIAGARETNHDGELCDNFKYLQGYVAGDY